MDLMRKLKALQEESAQLVEFCEVLRECERLTEERRKNAAKMAAVPGQVFADDWAREEQREAHNLQTLQKLHEIQSAALDAVCDKLERFGEQYPDTMRAFYDEQ